MNLRSTAEVLYRYRIFTVPLPLGTGTFVSFFLHVLCMTELRGDIWASALNVTCHNCHCRNTHCLFTTHLVMSGLKPQTIKGYLSGLRHHQIMAGLLDPFKTGAFPRLQYVIKGIIREKGVQIKPRFPITPHILRDLHGIWQSQTTQ